MGHSRKMYFMEGWKSSFYMAHKYFLIITYAYSDIYITIKLQSDHDDIEPLLPFEMFFKKSFLTYLEGEWVQYICCRYGRQVWSLVLFEEGTFGSRNSILESTYNMMQFEDMSQ